MPARMQTKRPRLPCQFEPRLVGRPIALAVIAMMAARHERFLISGPLAGPTLEDGAADAMEADTV